MIRLADPPWEDHGDVDPQGLLRRADRLRDLLDQREDEADQPDIALIEIDGITYEIDLSDRG